MRFYTITLKCAPLRIILCRQIQRRVERNPDAVAIAILITTHKQTVACLLHISVKLHSRHSR
ncbi:hypothetical protein BOW91_gp095 [Synechococcus phage S-WAM2]|uniref:Uncharacterized protein n=1 Tax=Synechococcus phage S-WAM2 TaxID=1815522 RepID=A0A1D8KT89_9CAUD|nr:hypothetical protein BOW91_gp095 [Synechococcus phage S-WAM2]AOV61851.1 hypothetical protein P29B0810_156 [Synechococcus phage S-WAM2]